MNAVLPMMLWYVRMRGHRKRDSNVFLPVLTVAGSGDGLKRLISYQHYYWGDWKLCSGLESESEPVLSL